MKCSCNHEFAPSAETFVAPQFFTTETGAVWLYLILHNSPCCKSTRALIMFCDEPDEEALAAE